MRAKWGQRLLYGLGVAAVVAAGTGVLITIPPFTLFIYPVYDHVYGVHRWVGLALGAPFLVGTAWHGVLACRARGFSYLTKTGLLFAVAFVVALATGIAAWRTEDPRPWVLVVHVAAGIVTAVAIPLHIRRWRGPGAA